MANYRSMRIPISYFEVARSLFYKATWFYVVCILTWYSMRYFLGDRFIFVRVGNFFLPWMFISLIVITGFAIFSRRILYSGLCMLLLLLLASQLSNQAFAYNFDIQPKINEANGKSFKVLTFNMNMANNNVDAVAALIKQANPDLVALQEVNSFVLNQLDEVLGDTYPFVLSQWRRKNFQVILSRYPTKNRFSYNIHNFQNTLDTFRVELETPQGLVTVWNIHPTTPLKYESWILQQQMLANVANEVATTICWVILIPRHKQKTISLLPIN